MCDRHRSIKERSVPAARSVKIIDKMHPHIKHDSVLTLSVYGKKQLYKGKVFCTLELSACSDEQVLADAITEKQ